MRLKQLNLTNFKGFTGTVDMEKLELYTGPHGAGKSRVKQAVEFLILGHIIDFSSVKADVLFRASSDQDGDKKPFMEVQGVWDTDFTFSRRITKSITKSGEGEKNAKYTQSCDCEPKSKEKEVSNSDFNARLAKEINPKEIMFSLDSFSGESSQEKKRFILRMSDCDHDTWNAEGIETYISDLMLTKTLLTNDEAMYMDYKNAIKETMELYVDDRSIEENCSVLLNEATKKEKYWKEQKKNAKSAAVKLTEIKNQTDSNTRGLKEDNEKKKAENQNLINLTTRKTNNTNQIEINIKNQTAHDEKVIELKEANDATNPYDQANLEKLIADYGILKVPQLKKEPLCDNYQVWKLSLEDATNIFDNNQESITEHRTLLTKLNDELNDLFAKNTLDADILLINGEITKLNNNIQKLQSGLCPLMKDIKCETDFTPFITSMNQQIEKYESDIEQVKIDAQPIIDAISSKETEITSMKDQIKVLETTSNDFYGDVTKYENLIKEEDNRVANKNDQYETDHQTALDEYESNTNSLNVLKNKLTECINFASNKAEKVAKLSSELEKLAAVEIVKTEDPAVIEKYIAANEKVLEDLETSIKLKEKALINLKNQQSTIIDINKATNMHFAYSKLKKHLGIEGILGEVLRNGLEPMREAIDKNLNILGKDVTFYFDTTGEGKKATFDYGWIVNDGSNVKRSVDSLSEGENLFLSTAMIVAFADTYDDNNFRILITDNLNHLDAAAIKQYLAGLAQFKQYDNIIVSGIVDDRIGTPIMKEDGKTIDHWELPEQFEGFNVNEV